MKQAAYLQEEFSSEIDAYYGYVSILCFPVCKKCQDSPEFPSTHEQFTEEWYMDQAIGIKDEGWVISEFEEAFCKKCAREEGVQHDPLAYCRGNGRMWSLIAILFLVSVSAVTLFAILF